jgi:Domain of unknown function (DUF1707)/2TM domain
VSQPNVPSNENHEPRASGPPALRVSDREREEVAEVLRKHAGEGRFDVAELDERLEVAYVARTRAELEPLTADLPPLAPPARPPTARRPSEWPRHVLAFVTVNLLLIGIWAASGEDYFWPIWPLLGWGFGLASHTSEAFLGRPVGPCSRRSRRAPHPAR